MARHDYSLDLSEQYIIVTSDSDGDVTLPLLPVPNIFTNSKRGNYFLVTSAGGDNYINVGADATSANAILPDGTQVIAYFAPGAVVHALLANTTEGATVTQVSFIRVWLNDN